MKLNMKAKRLSGFTLLELLIVISIIVILTGSLLVPRYMGIKNKAKMAVVRSNLNTIRTILETYYIDCNTYPSTEAGLNALVDDKDNIGVAWSGPYLDTIPLDPWRRKYVYEFSPEEERYKVMSYGADGRAGGKGANADIGY